jgi:hypothetical protein
MQSGLMRRRMSRCGPLPRFLGYASEAAIPIGEWVAEPVGLPREPAGLVFNEWLRSVVRVHG